MIPQDSRGRRALLKAASLAAVLFWGLHQVYLRLADWMHRYSPPTDPARVNPWLRGWVHEHDGIETVVMMLVVTAVLGVGLVIAHWVERIPWFPWWPVQLACFVPAGSVLFQMQSSNFTPPPTLAGKLAVGFGALVVVGLGWLVVRVTQSRPWLGRGLLVISFLVLSALVLMTANPPAIFDYGFFIGPALKLAQGEALGSFYLQYNLLGTYLFRLMMAFRLHVHQMQAVLGLVFAAWIGLYYLLAKRLMENRFLVFLFVIALLLWRLVAIDGGPTFYPQVGFFRMDLWVVLALMVQRFGFASRATAAAFALGYLADNVFGFLFFVFYLAALFLTLVVEWRAGCKPALRVLLGLAAPLVVVLAFQLWTFGGLTSPAGKVYQDVHVGFLPISPQSMFWGIVMVLLVAMGPIALDPDPKRRATGLFLYAFAATMLLYFYGRSHDHNLLNVSGIWVLIAFVALDRLVHFGLPRVLGPLLATLVVCVTAVTTAEASKPKSTLLEARFKRGVLIEPTQLDRDIGIQPDPFAPYRSDIDRVFLFAKDDAYLNYRYGLQQVGFFAPFYASVFAEQTAEFVRGLVAGGTRVVIFRSDPNELLALNHTQAMRQAHQQFALTQRGSVLEVVLAPSP
jgi:hypothetical protein